MPRKKRTTKPKGAGQESVKMPTPPTDEEVREFLDFLNDRWNETHDEDPLRASWDHMNTSRGWR